MYAFLTGWLGYASGSLFFKASTSSVDFNLIKADDLNVEKVVVSSNETTLSRPGKKFLLKNYTKIPKNNKEKHSIS